MITSQKKLAATLLVSVSLAVSWGVFSPQQALAASVSKNNAITAVSAVTGTIESSVRLRTSPSTSGSVVGYLNRGDKVTILEQPNDYWYKIRTSEGIVGYTSAGEQYIRVASGSSKAASGQPGVIQSSVRLREAPSMSGKVLEYLDRGDKVTILEQPDSYWYKVRTANGTVGYTSSADQYISAGGGMTTPAPAPAETPASAPSRPAQSARIEQVITAGMGYLGTPYEYGSSRDNPSTFDCSDFIRQIFLDAANLKLPADSRQQGAWVKENSTAVTDISALKRGDLMFFMDYRGNSASAYAGVNKSSARITHVGMYLGDGQIMHTYSVSSGGVRVDKLSASWVNRFLYGGSVIR